MRVLVCLLLALACLPVSLARAQSTGSAYAVDYDRFYRVDPVTRQATLIGTVGTSATPIADLSGLTTTPDGTLYVASDTLKSLVRINPATGAGSVVGKFNVTNNGDPTAPLDFGMTASCDGSLWLSSPNTRQLWKVNPATGNATLVGGMGHDITGLAVDHDALYGVGGRGEEGWYALDTASGHASLIGGLGSMVDYITSASPYIDDQGQVLAAFNYVPLPGNQTPPDWSDLARIDASSGQTRILGTITGPESLRGIGIRGFTMGPPACGRVAEPAAAVGAPTLGVWSRWLMVLAMAALGLGAVTRRARPHTRTTRG